MGLVLLQSGHVWLPIELAHWYLLMISLLTGATGRTEVNRSILSAEIQPHASNSDSIYHPAAQVREIQSMQPNTFPGPRNILK